jgi:hypothetical protein
MESYFQQDFSDVRLHHDAQAARSARAENALAYTVGNDIVFAADRYAPSTLEGQRLIAHELTHVVQQRRGVVAPREQAHYGSNDESVFEREAQQVENRFVSNKTSVERKPLSRGHGFSNHAHLLATNTVLKKPDTLEGVIQVGLIESLDEYTPPDTNQTFRVGDTAAYSLLMDIVSEADGEISFRVFNFEMGTPLSEGWRAWLSTKLLVGVSSDFHKLGQLLPAEEWRRLWPNPVPTLLRMHEEGKIVIPDKVILSAYRGVIRTEASSVLAANEKQIDDLLDSKDRVLRIKDYAEGLREASVIRDRLETERRETQRNEIEKVLVGVESALESSDFYHGLLQTVSSDYERFSFLFPQRENIPASVLAFLLDSIIKSKIRQLREKIGEFSGWIALEDLTLLYALFPQLMVSVLAQVTVRNEAIAGWNDAFPLLKRLRTPQINPEKVESTLATIKSNIVATRRSLKDLRLDPWDLQNVRGNVESKFGPKTKGIIEGEEKSRQRLNVASTGAMVGGGIALMFLPGGIFLDAIIGLAIAGEAWERANQIEQVSEAALDIDKGLMTRAQADVARWEAIFATITGVLGAASAGFRLLRVGRAFLRLSKHLPELGALEKITLSRHLASHPELIKALSTSDVAVIRTALRRFTDDPRALSQALKFIGESARKRSTTGDIIRDLETTRPSSTATHGVRLLSDPHSPIGPPFETFEAAEAEANRLFALYQTLKRKPRNPPHVLAVFVKDDKGKIVDRWFEVSERAGMLGHTEQKALSRINLQPGMTVEFIGHYSPCSLPGGCSRAMSEAALRSHVHIRYRFVYGHTGETTYEFPAGVGQVTQKDVKFH